MSEAQSQDSWGAASRVFRFGEMAKRVNANGSESRDVGHGAVPSGERVRVHQTMQPSGLPANPAHRIAHTELVCIREGTVEFVLDGVTHRTEAGDMVMVAKNSLHSLRNVGSGPASYFVVAIGGDV